MHPDEPDNGILIQINGEYVAQAQDLLPPVDTADDRPHAVELEAGHLGRVRLYARRQKARHNKHEHWYWLVYRAERVE